MSHLTCGFIGLGLIGGSIAKALKASDPDMRIIAYDTNPAPLKDALEEGVADSISPAIDASFSQCDYIFLCAPVQKNDSNLAQVARILSPDCLLTDVGSVKTAIHSQIRAMGLEHCFIGGHPMAGSERTGYASSRAVLLENAYYILTPTSAVPKERLNGYRQLVEQMGAIPLVLDSQTHDYVTAAISHLPHIVASSLVNLVRDSDSADGIMRLVAAGGFKDITRIASSSAAMWQQICLSNQPAITGLLADYIKALTSVKEKLDAGDATALYDFFDSARIYRDSFQSASRGPIKSSHSLHVDLADKAGALAHITTLLASHSINIKNLGISHNRESEDGVLRMEFYEEAAMHQAAQLLQAKQYSLHIQA